MVVPEGIEPPLGTNQVRTVYKAVGASSYTMGPKSCVLSMRIPLATNNHPLITNCPTLRIHASSCVITIRYKD